MADITTAPAPDAGTSATPVSPVAPAAAVTPTKPASVRDVLETSAEEWQTILGTQPEAALEPVADAVPPEPAPAAEPETPPTPGEYTQDAQGRWHRPDGRFAEADEISAITEAMAPEGVAPAPDAPKAPTVVPQGYQVTSADGTPMAEVPDLRFTYTANGKVRENVPLDQMIRHVQNATYHTDVQQEAVTLRQRVPELERSVTDWQQRYEQLEAHAVRLIQDDSFTQAAREAYGAANSPEARAERAERELAAVRSGRDSQTVQTRDRQIVEQTITPTISGLAQQYPTVSPEEVLGKLTLLATPLLVNGVVPSERLPDLQRIVQHDLAQWAQATHEQRDTTQRAVTSEATKRVEAAKVQAAIAKRQVARTVQPRGVLPATGSPREPVPPKTYKSTDDVLNDLDSIVRQGLGAA